MDFKVSYMSTASSDSFVFSNSLDNPAAQQRYRSACAEMAKGEFQAAVEELERVFNHMDSEIKADWYRNLGWCQFNLKRLDEARKNYQHALDGYRLQSASGISQVFTQLRIKDCLKQLHRLNRPTQSAVSDSEE